MGSSCHGNKFAASSAASRHFALRGMRPVLRIQALLQLHVTVAPSTLLLARVISIDPLCTSLRSPSVVLFEFPCI